MSDEKEIRWVGSAYDDLLAFPDDPRRSAGFQLGKVQVGLDPVDWKPFDDVGAGTKEIRIREASGIYRVMYVAKFEEAVYVLHCFQKKTQATSKQDKGIAEAALSRRGQCEKGTEMKIDTEIRHVTKPGANLFLELGFAPAEAKRLQAASRKQIKDTQLLKQQLMDELSTWIAEHHLKQAEAAEILMVSRPRVSDVVNKKTAKFTIDTLVEMLSRIGKPVKLAIG
jgi:phage-related protein/predicted XRE-type DNA-binding protein